MQAKNPAPAEASQDLQFEIAAQEPLEHSQLMHSQVEAQQRTLEGQIAAQVQLLKLQAEERQRERLAGPDPMVMHSLLAKAQAEFKPVVRNRTVEVWSQRTNRSYTFSYAELHSVLSAVMPALNRYGFYFRQYLDPADSMIMVSELLHAHGRIEGRVKIFLLGNDGQAYNSALTYARRAGAVLLFGVAAEDDDDGNLANGNEATVTGAGRKTAGKNPPAATAARASDPADKRPAPVHPEAVKQKAAEIRQQLPQEDGAEPDVPEGMELEKAEGMIVDACQELQEAATEGRAHGIEQIWGEIRGNQYVATRVWRKLKADSPDLFKTIKATLDKAFPQAATGKRGDRG
jgi:hypothetical protein